MKKQLTKTELYELFSNDTLRLLIEELKQYMNGLNAYTEAKIIHQTSNEIFLIEEWIRTKNK